MKESPDDSPFKERVGYFDIEASGLNATFAYMFSYCIIGSDGSQCGRVLTPSEIRTGKFDEKLTEEMARDLRKYHRIVTYYGGDHRFDLPFVRTRSIKHGVDFPLYKEVYATDLYPIVRNKLKLHSNRLE
ncbi:MAG: ribonuclease H-like domain-containing protein, partial [Syntrophales bacterium LBB04]|nr:ribonuclease H-like domain-containing protein [Syntrophales bacterium LBB04]